MTTQNKARQAWPIYLLTEHQRDLFIQVIMAGLPPSDAIFMCYVFPRMRQEEGLHAVQLGSVAHMNNSAALVHLKRLATKGFVKRSGFYKWDLAE